MTIRNAVPADAASICDLIRQATVHQGAQGDTGLYKYQERTPDDIRVKLFHPEASRYFYVDEQEGDITAFLEAIPGTMLREQFDPNLLHKKIPGHARSYLFVELVVVDAQHRRQGIAWQLYHHAFQATNGSYPYVVATICHRPFRNRASISLHRSLGFYPVKEVDVQYSDHPRPITMGVYRKRLNGAVKA